MDVQVAPYQIMGMFFTRTSEFGIRQKMKSLVDYFLTLRVTKHGFCVTERREAPN